MRLRKLLQGVLAALVMVVPVLMGPPANAHTEYKAYIGTCAIDGGSGYGRIQHDVIYSTSHYSTSVGAGHTDNRMAVSNYTNRTVYFRIRTYITDLDVSVQLYNSGLWTLGPQSTTYMPLLPTSMADDWFPRYENPRTIVDFDAAGGGDAQLVSWWKAMDHGGTVTCDGQD